ncbi:MAG: tetratricopeptide repeat protein [Caldilineaceae bacterium]
MAKVSVNRGSAILTKWIKEIKRQEQKEISVIQDELGYAIGLEGSSIYKWRQGNPPSTVAQAVTVAIEIFNRLNIVDKDEFAIFLSWAGHTHPVAVWEELHTSLKVDVPAAEEHFIRREKEIAEIIGALKPGEIISLCGPGGVGKTALVIATIQQLASDKKSSMQFPDGILYYNFYGGYTIDDACHYILKFFDEVIPEKPREYREAVRNVLRERQALIVLDGAEEVDNLGDLLRIHRNNGVLIVTRYSYASRGTILTLESPPLTLAINILEVWSSASNQPTFHAWRNDQLADSKVIEEICERLGRLPLALRLAGRYMLCRKVEAHIFLERLKKWHQYPSSLLHEGKHEHHLSVMLLMEKSLEAICKEEGAQEARNILAVAGLLSYAPFDLDTIVSALELLPATVLESIEVLTKFSMLKWISDKKYQGIHRLIHTYAQRYLAPTLPNWVLVFLAGYYIKLWKTQGQLGHESNAKLDTERPHFLAVLANCVDKKEWIAVTQLVNSICANEYLYLRVYGTEYINICESGLKAAQALNNREDESLRLNDLGLAYSRLGEMDKAIDCYQQAITIAKKTVERDIEGIILGNLATCYSALGKYQQAGNCYQQALIIAKDIGDRRGEEKRLTNLGNNNYDLGQLDKAIDYFQQALIIAKEIQSRVDEGVILGNLGVTYLALQQHEQASDYLQQAFAISCEIGDIYNQARLLTNLGQIPYYLGQLDKAIDLYQQAFAISCKIDDIHLQARLLINLGQLYYDLRQLDKAIEYYQQALIIVKKIGNHNIEGLVQDKLGRAYHYLGQYQTAIQYFQQALAIYCEINDLFEQVISLGNLSSAYYNLAQYQEALNYCQQAVDISITLENPAKQDLWQDIKNTILNKLHNIYFALGKYQEAAQYFEQALEITQKLDNHIQRSALLNNLGQSHHALGQYQEAINAYQRALDLEPDDATLYNNLAGVYLDLKQVEETTRYFHQRIALRPEDALNAYVSLGVIARWQGNELESKKQFELALTAWDKAWQNSVQSPTALLENKALAYLGLGQVEAAHDILKQAIDQRQLEDSINLILYDLLAEAPNPPQGVAEMRRLLEETQGSIKPNYELEPDSVHLGDAFIQNVMLP